MFFSGLERGAGRDLGSEADGGGLVDVSGDHLGDGEVYGQLGRLAR